MMRTWNGTGRMRCEKLTGNSGESVSTSPLIAPVDVKKSDVKRFYNLLVDDRGLKISTVVNIHNVLYQVFQIAVEDDMIRGNPTLNTMKELRLSHTLDTEKRKALSIEQEALLLDFLKRRPQYQHWYPIFYIMLNTGMRVGEITGLRWCDVDLEEGEISINHCLGFCFLPMHEALTLKSR